MAARVVRSKSKVAEIVLLGVGLASYLVPTVAAQQPAAQKRHHSAIKPPVVLISPVQPSAETLEAPRPLTPAELPPVVPQITWDGEQLSISAENSTLGSVLDAVKQTLGADIDVPPAAARERIVVHLGPGPAREVLSSLLTGTSFDYIIQAADDDPMGVQSVILTMRSKPGAAGANDLRQAILANNPRRRYGNPVPTPAENNPTPDESSVSTESAAAPAEAVAPAATPAPQTASASDPNSPTPATQPATADANSANPNPNPDTSATTVQADLTPPASSSSDNRPTNIRDQKVMEMENLFQQRRQMQEQALKGNQSN